MAITKDVLVNNSEYVEALISRYSQYIDEYKWFFDFNSILQNYDDVRKTITKEKVWENQQIFDKLYNNHQRGKIGGKIGGKVKGECKANNCKSVEINGITYKSKTEAMKKLGIGRKKLDKLIKNWVTICKSGRYSKKEHF